MQCTKEMEALKAAKNVFMMAAVPGRLRKTFFFLSTLNKSINQMSSINLMKIRIIY